MATDDQVIEQVVDFKSRFGFNVDVLHTEESLKLQEQRDEGFGLGDFEDLAAFVADLAGSFVDEMELEADYSQSCICFKFIVPDQENAAYLIGSNHKNIECIQTFLESQQIYPQDKLLKLVIEKEQVGEDSEHDKTQTFWHPEN